MNMLTAILVQIGQWLLTQLFKIAKKDYEQYVKDKKDAQDAKAKLEALKNAVTSGEIDKATDSSLSDL